MDRLPLIRRPDIDNAFLTRRVTRRPRRPPDARCPRTPRPRPPASHSGFRRGAHRLNLLGRSAPDTLFFTTSRPPERDQPCRIAALRSDHGVELRADQSHRDSAQFTVTRRGSSASPPSSWPGLTRPSTSLLCAHKKDVNDRLKRTMTIETFQGATRANAHSLLPADQRSTSGSSRICTGWHRSGSQTSPVPS